MQFKVKMMLISSALLFISIFSGTSSASVFTQCNSCYNQSSFKSTAFNIASSEGTAVTDVYVANFNNQTIFKYRVANIRSREPGVSDSLEIFQLTIPNDELYSFDNAVMARNSILSIEEDIPSYVAYSAYALVGSSYMRNNLSDYINDNASAINKAEVFITSVLQIAAKMTNVPIALSISFKDGSSGILAITPSIGTNLTIKVLELRDADNNSISLTPAGYKSGSYDFTTQGLDGLQAMIDAASRLGLAFGSNPGELSTTCVENGSGHLICTLIVN